MDQILSIEALPPSLARIAGIVGVEAALRISEIDGGRYTAIPIVERIDGDHWLAKLIGLKPALKLSRALTGEGFRAVSLPIERPDRRTEPDDWVQPLPPVLEDIASIAGTDAALKFAGKRSGTRFRFPTAVRLRAEHWLVQLLGFPDALRLCRELAHEENDIPQGPASERVARRRPGGHPLDQYLMAGQSLSASARKAGVDRSTARRRKVYLRGKGALK